MTRNPFACPKFNNDILVTLPAVRQKLARLTATGRTSLASKDQFAASKARASVRPPEFRIRVAVVKIEFRPTETGLEKPVFLQVWQMMPEPMAGLMLSEMRLEFIEILCRRVFGQLWLALPNDDAGRKVKRALEDLETLHLDMSLGSDGIISIQWRTHTSEMRSKDEARLLKQALEYAKYSERTAKATNARWSSSHPPPPPSRRTRTFARQTP